MTAATPCDPPRKEANKPAVPFHLQPLCDKEKPPTYCTWSDLTESEEGRRTGQRKGATVELWEVAQCSAERQRERGVGAGFVGGGLADARTRRTTLRLLRRSPPVAREITADRVEDARRRLL